MSKKPFGASSIYVILGLIFIALIGIRTISTPEIWTHLAQGETNAPLSYLKCDSTVNTTHVYDKVVYALWNAGGASALILFNVICLVAAFVLLLKASTKWGGGLSQGFSLLLCGQLIFMSVDVGPQIMMVLFIALFIHLLTTLKKPALIFGILIPLQILWTNMHGSFLFGPFIALLAAIQLGQGSKNRKKEQNVSPGLLGGLAVGLLISTLANPSLINLHKQVFADILQPAPNYWSSLLVDFYPAQTQNPIIFFALILGAGGLITLKKKLPIMLTTLALIGAFLVVRSAQSALLFTALAFPFMVLSFTAVGEALSGSFKNLLGKQAKLLTPVTQGILALLIVISMIPIASNCAYTKIGSASNFGFGIQEELYPSDLDEIIGHEAFPKKVLNLAADGGYLAFKYDREIFIDYRSGRYPIELLKDLENMLIGNRGAYDKTFEAAQRPEAIILNTLHPSSPQGLYTLLQKQIWQLAYFDGTTAILLQKKPEFAPILDNTKAQAAGLAKLEGARVKYAEQVSKGCRAGNPAELIGAARVFLTLNRLTESRALFSLILQGNDSVPSAWHGLGKSQLYLKEPELAMESLGMAVKLAPNSLMAWRDYGIAAGFAGATNEVERATKMFKELAEKQKAKQKEIEEEEPESETEVETKESILDLEIPE